MPDVLAVEYMTMVCFIHTDCASGVNTINIVDIFVDSLFQFWIQNSLDVTEVI